MMNTACIDNHILIWGVRKQATPGQDKMIERAELFLEYCDAAKTRIIVPAIVIGEFLVKTPPEKHEEISTVLDKRFRIAPYDAITAASAARILQEYKASGVKSSHTNRDVLKADIQILATAITRKCDVLYTHDEGLTALAERYIKVCKMPESLGKQTLMFPEASSLE
jgi:predicted nucleic acid-binding protein